MVRKARWLASLGVVLGLSGTSLAGDVVWRAIPPTQPAAAAVTLGRPVPAATLDRPVAVRPAPIADGHVAPVSYQQPPATVVRAQGPPDVPPPGPPGAAGPIGSPPLPGSEPYNSGIPVEQPVNRGWWDNTREALGMGCCGSAGHSCLQSDHCFDHMISPITNPFLFEDPRALTEIRPIILYQTLPSSNPALGGGNAQFYGTQLRAAFTERFSVVINKLGFVRFDPDNQAGGFSDSNSFGELWLGPKYTFIRNETSNTVAAGGLTFQIPTGSDGAIQNTGDLSLTPYFTIAQSFGRSSYGGFNFLAMAGYTLRVDNARTDNFNGSLHLDYDVANAKKFYPLIELNWFHYTRNGKVRPTDFEGSDLFNLGSQNVAGTDLVTLAGGFRYKFTEAIQLGVAGEWALTGRDQMENFRLNLDMIFRY